MRIAIADLASTHPFTDARILSRRAELVVYDDDPAPAVGGGMLVTMGVHGVELLVSLLGPEVRAVSATAAAQRYTTLASEDTAVISLRWAGGIPASVTFLGVTESESYEVVLHTASGDRRIVLEGGAEPEVALGFRGTLDAFLSMVDGAPSPVPWSQTHAVLSALVSARELSLA